jgi:N-ethylmaleimide reductase
MKNRLLLSPPNLSEIPGLKNRIVMAPMTRSFASEGHLCNAKIANYYRRRAEAGVALIVTEGIVVHPSANGYNSVPHLYTEHQSVSWNQVVEAVKRHNTKIYAQLWHCGRISHSDYTNGFEIVSSTNKTATGINRQNNKPYGTPRALKADEMIAIYKMFCDSAELAFRAGFDGIQLHMGHGYLVDQFLDSRINDRTDHFGGSVENRCRFALGLLESVIARFGSERIMVRISPSRMMDGLYEWENLDQMLDTLIHGFLKLGLRQLDISCANADYFQTSGKVIRKIRSQWPHLLIGGASLSVVEAAKEVGGGNIDLVTWGRAILANPDFVRLIASGEPLRPFEESMRATLY